MDEPVLIEVAVNESVRSEEHPHVPTTPDRCAADAIEAVRAGASFAHWHAPDVDAYAAAWRVMRATDVIAYPTYPNQPADDASRRLAHCWQLIDEERLEMAPLDLGTAHRVMWDGESLSGGGTLANPLAFLIEAARRYRDAGVVTNLASFDLGHTRLAVRLARTGVLTTPLVLKIYLSDTWLVGPEPTPDALDLHLAQIPDDVDVRWLVVPFRLHRRETFEVLCRHALARGGGFRVGIGDNPSLFPLATNAELVAMVQPWLRAAGRRAATTAEVRALRP